MNPLAGSLLPRWWKDRGGSTVGGEGCANIVSSFLHYVDWIWTGYRRGFSTRRGPEFSTRRNSRAHPSSPSSSARIHSFWSVYIHSYSCSWRPHDRAQVHVDASQGHTSVHGSRAGNRGVSAVGCMRSQPATRMCASVNGLPCEHRRCSCWMGKWIDESPS